MLAAIITRPGGPEVLQVRDTPRPNVGTGEVLVRIRASALNRADILQREGRYPAPPGAAAEIPGLEFAGEVAELGEGVQRWREGDRVFGIAAGGGNAEYIAQSELLLARVPDSLSFTDAAAVPEAFITAHDALATQAGTGVSERVLIHAVGSGVGLAAVQVARAMGAVPYGTARTADKLARGRAYGLQHGVAVGDDLSVLEELVAEWTGGTGMQVILDLLGGPYLPASVRVAAKRGRIVLIGTIAGGSATLPIGSVLAKRLTIRGTVLRARPMDEKIAATRAFEQAIVPLLSSGVIRPVVDRVFPLREIRAAHELMESNRTFGKVVLAIGEGA